MSCLITAGYAADCSNAVGGIKEIYISDYYDVIGDAGTTMTSNNITVVPATTVYPYVFRPENAGLDIAVSTDATNGVTFDEQTLTLRFNNFTLAALDLFRQIAYARPIVFALDRQEQMWLLGGRNGMQVQDMRGSAGKMFADGNGFDITLIGREKTTPTVGTPVPGAANYPFDAVTGITVG